MSNQSPNQCDICFQPYAPFTCMRVLPTTPITTLSGTALPRHVRTPDAQIAICRHCREYYSDLEPWTDPAVPASSTASLDPSPIAISFASMEEPLDLPTSSDAVTLLDSSAFPDPFASLEAPDPLDLPTSSDAVTLLDSSAFPDPSVSPTTTATFTFINPAFPVITENSVLINLLCYVRNASFARFVSFSSINPACRVRSASFARFVSFPIHQHTRSPPSLSASTIHIITHSHPSNF